MKQCVDRGGFSHDFRNHSGPGENNRPTKGPVSGAALLVVLVLAFYTVPALAQAPAAGRDLGKFYQQNCAKCHGPDGSAVSADGKKLHGQDFTDPEWQKKTSDAQMTKRILNGKFFGLAMPKFKNILTTDEIQKMITDIIRKAKKGQVIGAGAELSNGK